MSPFVAIPISNRRVEPVRIVNEAKTEREHDAASSFLRGWDDCYRALAGSDALFFQVIDCDEEFGDERPVCCGEWLDWEPEATDV